MTSALATVSPQNPQEAARQVSVGATNLLAGLEAIARSAGSFDARREARSCTHHGTLDLVRARVKPDGDSHNRHADAEHRRWMEIEEELPWVRNGGST